MMRLFIVAAAALCLSACGNVGGAVHSAGTAAATAADAAGVKPPAPLAGTTADERAGIALLTGYDAFLYVVDTLDKVGALPPTSAKVQQLADLIDKTTAALRTAAAARRLGNAETFTAAFAEAEATFALAQKTLGGS